MSVSGAPQAANPRLPLTTAAVAAPATSPHLSARLCAALQVMRGAGAGARGLTFAEYRAALEGVEIDLHVEVPVED